MARSTYQAFAKVFSSYHDQYAAGPSSRQLDSPLRHDAVLDEEGGMLVSLMAAVEQSIRSDLPGDSAEVNDQLTPEEQEALLLEHRTWQLIRAVYENRLRWSDPSFVPLSSAQALLDNPYLPPEDLTQILVNEDPVLSLYATLIDRLQSRPLLTVPPPLEARHGYLPSTLRRLQGRAGKGATPASLDPDFTLRDPHGPGLAGEDQTYQTPLLETLWDLVRHGELDQAVKVCEAGGEPWRGASIMGGRRWTMGGLTSESLDSTPLEGNRMRALWKRSCRAIAKNPTLSAAERNLYAALVCDLPALLPACETWEDHLWAHIQSRLESRLERQWHDLAGFWEEVDRGLSRDDDDQEMQGGLDKVFSDLQNMQKEEVMLASRNPFYVAQKMIILGRTDSLLNQFAERISGLEDSVSPELIGPLIRFFTHLILLLRTLGQSVPNAASNVILQAYLQVLEQEGSHGLVAMYAACLREGNGEESYARFLKSMDPNASRIERSEALARASQHHLDVASIAGLTVEMILSEAFADIPALSLEEPDVSTLSSGLTERDMYLIRSLEWLTMIPDTREEALIKANDVARYFLAGRLLCLAALGNAGAAEALIRTLPSDILTIVNADDPGSHALEHEQYHQLFAVFACYELVSEVLARLPKRTATKLEHHNWRKSLRTAIDRTDRATRELLISDWLRFPLSPSSTFDGMDKSAFDNEDARRLELARIRQVFIPDLVLRLHGLLVTHRTYFPELLQQALDLTRMVAAEEHHVYEEFLDMHGDGAARLAVYLERVREASLLVLEGGSLDPFVALVPA